ncbi:hypothetical protein N7T98_26495, partial [Pseudomonas syringae pv. tomato]|uniref:hypothetical protein n=1 Tax=Pseudomonas syringae group genomosp. 3 TaxID=251701 RepID=UPI0022A7A66B
NKAVELIRVKRKTDTKEVYAVKLQNNSNIILLHERTSLPPITFYANMYELFNIYAEVNSSYKYVELCITDRFTMNSYKKQIELTTTNSEAFCLIDNTRILVS